MRQILHRYTQAIIWEGVETVKDAIEARADLSGADLSGRAAGLSGAVRLAIAHVQAARDALEAERSAVAAERDRIAGEEAACAAAATRARDAAERAERERIEAIAREERLEAMRPDLQKLTVFAGKIRALAAPTVKTDDAKRIVAFGADALARVARDLDTAIKGAA